MPVGGPRRKKKDIYVNFSETSGEPLTEIAEETLWDSSSDAEESWTQVQEMIDRSKGDVEMVSDSESESPWKNQGEVDAAQHLTSLYNNIMLNNELTPEGAYDTMLANMMNDDRELPGTRR